MSITTEYIVEPVQTTHDQPVPMAIESRLDTSAFYIFLATVVLAPLAFLPTAYIALDVVKTVLIAMGTIISAVLYGVSAYKKGVLVLPSRSISISALVVVISIIISTCVGLNATKSFFGQGFELGSGSFILILFLSALVAFTAFRDRVERVTAIYVGMATSFVILALLHGLRLIFGPSFATLNVLTSPTATIAGSWYDLAIYSIVVAIIAVTAIIFLPLSRRIKAIYMMLTIVAFAGASFINSPVVWIISTLVFGALTICLTLSNPPVGEGYLALLRRTAWIPLIVCVISGILFWKGMDIASPAISATGTQYTALSLPWQTSIDVTSGAIKDHPFFGVGPNQFGKAYIAYRPLAVNSSYTWNAEFNYAFGLLPTFIATQGIVGMIAWGLFLVFLILAGIRILRKLPSNPYLRFTMVSSTTAAVFLWMMSVVSVPSFAMLYYAYVLTAVAIGSGVASGLLGSCTFISRHDNRLSRLSFNIVSIALVVIAIIWGSIYIKDFVAFAYFGSGVKALTTIGDPLAADNYFMRAQQLNASDIYLQARVEAGITRANQLIARVNSMPTGTSTQALIEEIKADIDTAAGFARSAIAYDPTNYYNYLSSARVSELASNIQMANGYENAIQAYTEAIKINPLNPMLYVNLAQLQASNDKLDDALKSVGAALQVKSDYLDAIFLLSQITAAQGNLKDAITAAKVGTEINPQSPVLFFQLGLLRYTNKEYTDAVKALESAVALQTDYANAHYFLGLSYARIGEMSKSITEFEGLSITNPENQEIALILSNLKAGKSPFSDAKPPVTSSPEKRSTLPISEKKK